MKKAAPVLLALLIAACAGSQEDTGMMEEGQGMMGADSAQMGEMGGMEEMSHPDTGMGGMADPDSGMGNMADPDTGMAASTAGMGGR